MNLSYEVISTFADRTLKVYRPTIEPGGQYRSYIYDSPRKMSQKNFLRVWISLDLSAIARNFIADIHLLCPEGGGIN